MKRKILFVLLTIAAVATAVLFYALKSGIVLNITEQEIQSAVYAKFPIEKTHLLVLKMTYADPVVELIDDAERVRIGITMTPHAEVGGKRYSGSVVVNGGFRYEPGSGKVFLTGFAVEKIALEGHKEIRADKLSATISELLEDVYSKYPIYELKRSDLKQAAAQMLVRKVSIRNKVVSIELGL